MASNNVSVAVRIRPKLQKEQIDMCNICTRVSPDEPQVWLGHDKAFTFDYVFDIASHQFDVYDNCVRTLVDGCFEGFNATVLAYGQTGSGKTYTMGTGFDVSSSDDQRGIIPRAVYHLFDSIQSRKEEAKANGLPLPEFNVTAQFIEIYNEELIDLLCEKRRKGLQIRIHEDQKRGIILTGVENKTVSSAEDTLACLKSGSLFRTTGATLMNAESSRSHAIFTLFIKQSRVEHVQNGTDEADSEPQQELLTLTAKFNFVDLAGSERLSRTGAVGERAREGISINSGLLHLGNVISALGDRSKKSSHIPYRDSKLTRVLQDSLGGNSVTTMIACISPCDRDFVETLNTLRYANRAKNIKNKVVANQDSQTQLINELRRQLMQLQVENQELKQGKLFVKNDGELELNDVYLEKEMLQRDLNNANIRIKALNTRLEGLTTENISIRGKMAKLQISNGDAGSDDNESDEDCAGSLIKGYLKEINTLRSKVIESEYTISYYREQLNKQETKELNDQDQPIDIIERAKYEIELGKSRLFHMNSSINSADSNGNRFSEGNDNYDNNGDLSGDEDEVQDEFEKKMADQNAEIATLMEIISSKERLIEEAEAREKRIIELTNHYEQKISSFKSKIKQTEDERDILISKYKRDNKEDHNSKRLKDDYDRRVAMLQSEVRKYEALKREHDKVLRNESSSKDQLKKLRQEIIETKKKRVQLMGEMRQQMNRHNKEMQKSKLVINKLTREDYKKDVKIRDLVVQSNQQKKLLQRRDEELKVLRRRVKPMSDRVAGRITHVKRNNHGHTPQKARNMWHNFEQKFNELVMLRISFDKEEKKLERYLAERQNNINIINTLKEDHVDGDLNTEYLDNLQVNIDYLSKCIEDSQNMIMQIEEDNFNIEQMFDNCDMSEIMYIVNNLANSAIIYAIRASEKDEELKEKDSKLATLWNENAYSNHLLNYMVSKNFDGEENGVYPPGAINPLVNVDPSLLTPAKSSNDNKFRRLTMTPSELLYQSSAMEAANQTFVAKQLLKVDEDEDYVSSSTNHDGHSSPKSPNGTFVVDKNFDSTYVKETNDQPNVPNDNLVMHQISDRMTQSLHVDHPPVASSNANHHHHLNAQPLNRNGVPTDSGELYRVPSAPSLKDLTNHQNQNHHHQFTASTPVHQTHHHHSHHHHSHNQNSHLLSPRLLRRKIHQQSALMPPPPPPPLNNNNHSASNTANNNSNNVNGSSSNTTSASSATNSGNSNNKARLIRSVSNNGAANSNNNYYNNCNGSATSNGTTLTNSPNNSNSSTSSSHHHHHSPNNKAEYNNNTTSNSSATNIPAASNSFPQQPKQYNGHSHYYSQHHQPSPQASPSLSSSRHAFLHDPYTTTAAAANQYNGTPPGSPSVNRRLNRDNSNSMASSITQDSDVFSRLTNTSSMTRQPVEYSVGRIEPASSSKGHNDKSFPLVCTHTVVGHQRSVLSVTATNEVLFSGSKDGTARIWDLGQGEEVFSLNDHPDSVNVVRYDEYNKLIFTCSKSIIKIWDPRQKPVNCVHTLCASGLMVDNVVNDSFIHDMRLSADGSTLFSATEKLVRIFDLRTFQNIGKLNTGHKSLVTCLAVDNEDLNDTRIVITGSKDHFVKVFELDGEMSGIHTPKITLNPPHFDGIEALRLTGRGQYLFSGGRDGCIRKWDLTRHRMAASLSNCHRDWVLALNTLPQTSILLSACRSGYLRVWNTEDCSPFGEIQAHGRAINDIATIPQVAFTASSDCQIHVWQHRETAVNDDSA